MIELTTDRLRVQSSAHCTTPSCAMLCRIILLTYTYNIQHNITKTYNMQHTTYNKTPIFHLILTMLQIERNSNQNLIQGHHPFSPDYGKYTCTYHFSILLVYSPSLYPLYTRSIGILKKRASHKSDLSCQHYLRKVRCTFTQDYKPKTVVYVVTELLIPFL